MMPASRLAGDSMLGSLSMDSTLTRIASTPRIGLHRSSALSYSFMASTPGACSMLMHTLPSGYIFGCHISVLNLISGGLFG